MPASGASRVEGVVTDEERPLRTRVFYASGSVSGNVISQAFSLWLIFFYAPPSGEEDAVTRIPAIGLPDLDFGLFSMPDQLAPRVVLGLLLTVARIVESIDDPVVGYLTDRTKSRWGRRIPWILLGTPWWALLFAALFIPPESGDGLANLVWLVVIIEIFWLTSNLSGAPLEALLPHIAKTHQHRVTVAAFQLLFGVFGAFIGLSISSLLVGFVGFPAMAATMAVIALATRYTALFGCWSHAKSDDTPSTPGFKRSVRETFSNKQFVAFLPSFIFFRIAQLMLTALFPFYVSAALAGSEAFGFNGAEDAGVFTFGLTVVVIIGVLVGIGFFMPLARRKGNAHAFRTAMLWGMGGLFLLFFAGFMPGPPKVAQAMLAVFIAGMPLAGILMLPNILIADIVDHDARRTSTRREGMFYGTQNLLEKSASAFAPLLLAIVLLAGDNASDPLGVRLVGPVAGVLVFIGYLSFRGYTLDEQATEESAAAR